MYAEFAKSTGTNLDETLRSLFDRFFGKNPTFVRSSFFFDDGASVESFCDLRRFCGWFSCYPINGFRAFMQIQNVDVILPTKYYKECHVDFYAVKYPANI